MPELPEVEAFGKYFDKTSLNKKIENVEVKNPEILQNIDADDLKEKLEGQKFQFTKRYGKNLFAHLNNDFWLILHFGMTGKLKYFQKKDEGPSYDRILINFEDNGALAFVDPRKFGKVNLTDNMENFIKEKKLGHDALEVDLKTFKELLEKRKGAIKTVLMNQHVLAGVGNIYSDEILFQTCIHPKTGTNKLKEDKIEDIFNIMESVLKTAIDRNIKHRSLPNSFIIPHRVKNGRCPNSDVKLKTIKVSGRTAYYCPECQKELF
ncbi:Fpg/Nei family DNA glycosylase [Methanobacterium oryzae]|uniref:Fpg/Nei family DNA glycosylase n=1 Tax=Methanobacterium oryzae TaxID=69540 RepID=UPI003D263CBA